MKATQNIILVKKFLCISILNAIISFVSLAENKKTNYIGTDLGYSRVNKVFSDHHDNRINGSIFFDLRYGHIINKKFKTDMTVTYRGRYKYSSHDEANRRQHQKISSLAIMVNGYFFPNFFESFDPYLMMGMGVAVNKAKNLVVEGKGIYVGDQRNNLAWQIGGGTLCKITNNVNIDLMYKYVDLGLVSTKGLYSKTGDAFGTHEAIKGKLKSHEVSLGISYCF